MPDDTPITRAQADRLLELCSKVLAEVEHLVAEGRPWRQGITDRLVEIEGHLEPVESYYSALNQARDAADAALTTANARAEVAKKTAIAEWVEWLTPWRMLKIAGVIVPILGLGGAGAMKVDRIVRAIEVLVAEPPAAEPEPEPANDAPADPAPGDPLPGGSDGSP